MPGVRMETLVPYQPLYCEDCYSSPCDVLAEIRRLCADTIGILNAKSRPRTSCFEGKSLMLLHTRQPGILRMTCRALREVVQPSWRQRLLKPPVRQSAF